MFNSKKSNKKILLDSNFLTIPHQFKVDIFEEINRVVDENYGLMTTQGVIDELKNMAKHKGKHSVAAKMGLELLKRMKVKVIKTDIKPVDEEILKICDENTIVATNDKKLRKKLKSRKLKTIYLRGKKRLEIG